MKRRRRYEVQLIDDAGELALQRRVTRGPVILIDRHLGVGDAWALVHAEDDAWSGSVGPWVTLGEGAE